MINGAQYTRGVIHFHEDRPVCILIISINARCKIVQLFNCPIKIRIKIRKQLPGLLVK